MADVYNSILIGFEWAQDLTLAAGMIVVGDQLRADFRYKPEDAAPIFSIASAGGDGIVIASLEQISLVAAKAKTKNIAAPDPKIGWRPVVMDLVRISAGGVESHLGFRLTIPAELPITRAAGSA